MIRSSTRSCQWLMAGVAIAAISTAGCAGLNIGPLDLFATATIERPPVLAGDAGAYEVDLFPEGQPPVRIKLPLKESTFVQNALEASGATKRFEKMKVMVIRSAPESGQRHKLDVEYVSKKGRVSPATDYALHSKDRVVVIEDTTSKVGNAVGDVTRPLGRILSFGG